MPRQACCLCSGHSPQSDGQPSPDLGLEGQRDGAGLVEPRRVQVHLGVAVDEGLEHAVLAAAFTQVHLAVADVDLPVHDDLAHRADRFGVLDEHLVAVPLHRCRSGDGGLGVRGGFDGGHGALLTVEIAGSDPSVAGVPADASRMLGSGGRRVRQPPRRRAGPRRARRAPSAGWPVDPWGHVTLEVGLRLGNHQTSGAWPRAWPGRMIAGRLGSNAVCREVWSASSPACPEAPCPAPHPPPTRQRAGRQ